MSGVVIQGYIFSKKPPPWGVGISICISRTNALQWAVLFNFAHFTLFLYILQCFFRKYSEKTVGKSIRPNLGVGNSIFLVENIYPCNIIKFRLFRFNLQHLHPQRIAKDITFVVGRGCIPIYLKLHPFGMLKRDDLQYC